MLAKLPAAEILKIAGGFYNWLPLSNLTHL